MPPTSQTTKEKKSYTISTESVKFLEAHRLKLQSQSVSAALEEILQSARRQQEQELINRALTNFYDSVPDEEREEESQWGHLGLQDLVEKS